MKYKLLILSLLALGLTACGSKRLKSDQAQEDITRPPTIAVSKDDSAFKVPTKADETVSYGEWLKENSSETPVVSEAPESAEEEILYDDWLKKNTPQGAATSEVPE